MSNGPETTTYAVASGLQLEADHWGDPTGRPVVFLHGGGQTRHSWGGAARHLASHGWHCVTVDLRGHGGSDWCPASDYQLSTFAADIEAVIQNLDAAPVLVGASLGGLTGIVLEGSVAPGSLAALILVDIVPNMDPDGADRIVEFMLSNAYEGFGSIDEVAAAVAEYNPHRPPPTDPEGLKKNLRFRDGRWYWHWDPTFIDQPVSLPEVRDPDFLAEACGAITVPLLLIRGQLSDLVTEAGAREFLRDHPHARVVDVSDAGHMVAGDKNDVFTAAVVAFLDDVSS